ncbi:MAG: DUF4157 domain-containing protein [bacterium]|nr:DUF4157 domain-containing protein [bacterium]
MNDNRDRSYFRQNPGKSSAQTHIHKKQKSQFSQKAAHKISLDPTVDYIMQLQRTIGNKAVERLIKTGVIQPDRISQTLRENNMNEARQASASLIQAKSAHVWNEINSKKVQTKMTVGSPNDRFEQEADRVAETVVNMSDADVQRETDTISIQAKFTSSNYSTVDSTVDSGVESGIRGIKGGGQTLDSSTRRYYESRFDHDFSNVRIHTGERANKLSQAINARAFTTGRDIFFANNEYSHATRTGKLLLAHELTHVVQQGKAVQRSQRKASPQLQQSPQIQRKGNGARPQIRSTAPRVIRVGDKVTYSLDGVPESTNFKYYWYAQNDPSTYALYSQKTKDLPESVEGPKDKKEWKAFAQYPGTHIIKVDVYNGDRYISSAIFEQIVVPANTSEEEFMFRAMNITPNPRAIKLVGGQGKVTPDVAFAILDNLNQGKPAFKPELGKGGCSWFVTEGDPYTSVTQSKSVEIPAELKPTSNPLKFNEVQLMEIYNRILNDAQFKAEMEAKYREFNKAKIPKNAPLSNTKKKGLLKLMQKAAESRMWDEVGKRVRNSSNGVGEVILENSKFSKKGNGRFLVVSDASKIQVKGGMDAVVQSLKAAGVEAPVSITEAAKQELKRLRRVGQVKAVFKWGGRILIVAAIGHDLYRIYKAEDRLLTTVEVAGGWAGAAILGTVFATWYTPADVAGPLAWVGHGVGTLIAGGVGYWVGSKTTVYFYKLIIKD